AAGLARAACGSAKTWSCGPCSSLRGGGLARQQGAGGGGDVRLTHQAFADEEGRDADLGEAGEVGWGIEPALADDDAVLRDARGKALGDGQSRLEGAQVAVVYADQLRL